MMNDAELDQLIRTTARAVPAHVHAELDELGDAIVAARRPQMRQLFRPLVAVVASAAALTGFLVMPTGGSGSPAYAAELVAVAKAAPRVLVGADGWHIARADEFAPETGEITFEDKSPAATNVKELPSAACDHSRSEPTCRVAGHAAVPRLDVQWVPAASTSITKLADESDIHDRATVAGHEAVVYRYTGTHDYTAWWTDDDSIVEARGVFASLGEFKQLIGSIREVSVDEWLAAMPESVITPSRRADVVDRMLVGIDTPPGFDADALRSGSAVKDRYQLGAAVSSAVACGWIERWIAANDAGEVEVAQAAVRAMAGSHDWPVLHEMERDGDYPKVLWELADAMADEQRGDAPHIGAGYKGARVRDTYRDSLGCN